MSNKSQQSSNLPIECADSVCSIYICDSWHPTIKNTGDNFFSFPQNCPNNDIARANNCWRFYELK